MSLLLHTIAARIASWNTEFGLLPIFDMNLPEGALRAHLVGSFAKATGTFDDFDLRPHAHLGFDRGCALGRDRLCLSTVDAASQAGRRELGEALCTGLLRISAEERPDAAPARQLWLVEAALGTHFLDAAGSLGSSDAEALRPILLDDWLIEYEQYARALANPPRGAGHLWRLPQGPRPNQAAHRALGTPEIL